MTEQQLRNLPKNREKIKPGESGKKKSSGCSTGLVIFAGMLVFIVILFMTARHNVNGVLRFIWILLTIIMIIMFAVSMGNAKKAGIRGVPLLPVLLLASTIIAAAVSLINPVSDLYYYGASIICMAAVFFSLIDLIRCHNRAATRMLPQFKMYQGGDDRA